MIDRRALLLSAVATLALQPPAHAADKLQATVHKDPDCGCCAEYAKLLEREGYAVRVVETRDLAAAKRRLGVPVHLEGCHTTELGGYVVEGHVPLAAVRRLLAERPAIRGIVLPGMPDGSPGMSGRKAEPFAIMEIAEGAPRLWALE